MIKSWPSFKRDGNGDDRSRVVSLLRFTAIAVAVAIAIIAIGEASRHGEARRTVAPAAPTQDPLAAELTRCRAVTPEQLAIDESCRRVWAENRRRFFAPTGSAAWTTDTPRKAHDQMPASAPSLSSGEAR